MRKETMPEEVFPPDTTQSLTSVYEQMIWLGKQPGVNPREARAWYSHVVCRKFTRQIRRFSGKISEAASVNPNKDLCLEHFYRMQKSISDLLTKHLQSGQEDPGEFIELLAKVEQVHIVLATENREILAKGGYENAGIKLVDWWSLAHQVQHQIWTKKLRGKVSNASHYCPVAG